MYLHGKFRGHTEWLQEHDSLLNALPFHKRGVDVRGFGGADPLDGGKTHPVGEDDLQGILTEGIDDFFGGCLPYTVNDTGGEIQKNGLNGGGEQFFKKAHLKLLAVIGMCHPFTGQRHLFART